MTSNRRNLLIFAGMLGAIFLSVPIIFAARFDFYVGLYMLIFFGGVIGMIVILTWMEKRH